MSTRRINFANLDALRGLLAVYVALGHCRWLLWAGHAAWLASPHASWEAVPAFASGTLRYGREAVMVFFVLSGFFIHFRAAGAQMQERFSASTFYRRRWHRLAPPYFFALAVTVLCDVIGRTWWPTLYDARTGDRLIDVTFAQGGYTVTSIVPALLLLPSTVDRNFGSNGALWSLAYEAVYYMMYPAWLWVRQRSRTTAFVVIPAVCLLLALYPVGGFATGVLISYPIWLAGALLAERLVGVGVPAHAVTIGVGLFAGGGVLYLVAPSLWVATIASAMFGGGLVLAFAGAPQRDGFLLRFFEQLGIRSYTIYIVHLPVLVLLSAYVFETLGGRPLHGWLAVTGAVVSVGAGWLCFEVCERHFLHSRYRDSSAAP